MATAISGVNSTYRPVMKPALAVVVKRIPSVCSQKTTTRTSPSQMPSSTPRRVMGIPFVRMITNITRPARGNRSPISAPTERPPSSTMRVAGKPKPHIVATSAMMSTAVPWETDGELGREFIGQALPLRAVAGRSQEVIGVLRLHSAAPRCAQDDSKKVRGVLQSRTLTLYQPLHPLDERLRLHRAFAPLLSADAHVDLAGLHFLVADDELERHLLHGMFADFRVHLLVAHVNVYANAGGLQLVADFVRIRVMLLADRHHNHLHRRQPHRKRSRIVLDEHAEEALD